jgi:hypothetical protein
MLLAPKLGGSPSPTKAERIFERRRGVVRDDGLGAFFGRSFSEWSASKAASAMTNSATAASRKALACAASPFWPAVRTKPAGQPSPRTARWILVLRRPRERPMA